LLAQQNVTVKGKILDPEGIAIEGVAIFVKETSIAATSGVNGDYILQNVPVGSVLEYALVGYVSVTKEVKNASELNVVMMESTESLEEVTIVAFGTQKKESVISSIQTINAQELRVPSSNLTTAFAGRIAGMISYQTSGEPGYDDASFFIRGITTFGSGKVNPLILIDNVEVSSPDLAKMHPDDIASFSVLKDATATSLYGARGANGVILISTQEGREGKAKVSFRIENSFSAPTTTVEMADPITYMRLANEAVLTRNPLGSTPYMNAQIDNTSNPNRNQYVYPAVDWMDMLTKNQTINQRGNLNISGGGTVARYYIAGSFSQDNGVLKVDKRNNFNSNVNYKKYLIRSNVNINLSKSTEAIVRVHGTFADYTGPMAGGSDMYKKILQVSPVRFPAYFAPDEFYEKADHILFGNSGTGLYMNPYAELVKGYREESNTSMMAQIELKQDFGSLLKGLTGRLLGNTIRNSAFDLSRSYSPFYYSVAQYDKFTDVYTLSELNTSGTNKGNEYISYDRGDKTISSSFYGEASLAYSGTFNEKHTVSAMAVGIMRNALTANASTLSESLPQRNMGLSGRVTYAFDNRYLSEINFGYNGSEKFDVGHRWGFFPSFGLGWVLSNEPFWTENLKKIISKLKFKGTYGLVGNDEIGSQRFFYLSQVTPGGGGSYNTGYNYNGISRSGYSIGNYPNSDIGWEIAYKTNLGIELGLFKGKVDIAVDLFQEHRTNILQPRADIPTSMGLWSTPDVNMGEALGKGMDISIDYNHTINKDAWVVGRANFTYAHSVYEVYEEPDYAAIQVPWLSNVGNPVSQGRGYVAERLFIDEADVANSPRQDFSEYLAGDIKYKDIDNDGVIGIRDKVPIGYPKTPEFNYGFGVSGGYKGLDVSVFFQGSGRYSFWIDASAMSPFKQTTSGGRTLETGLAKFIADDHWSESAQNPYALWPRLSNRVISNNAEQNTWFMRNGSFLRFKSFEIGYSLPNSWVGRIGLRSCRIYFSGTNLYVWSKFKLWDVEMGGNGLNYPLQRVTNIGLNLSF
jgi:TonB-linked SusC/RagA family outer membrane protein